MNRRLIHPLGAALCAIVLIAAGCAASKPAAPRAASVLQPAAGGLNPADFQQIWMQIAPLDAGDALGRLFVDQDLVMACSDNNVVYVIDKPTGVLKFFNYVNGGGQAIKPPVVLPKYIAYLGMSNVEVYRRSNGDYVKSIPLNFTISSGGVGNGNDIYLGATVRSGELIDISIPDPYRPVAWRMLSFGEVHGTPAFYNDIIYVGSGDGGVRAVSPDRTAQWPLDEDKFDTGGRILGDIQADSDGVYVASTSGRLICLDPNTGKLKWQYFAADPLTDGPAVTRTSVYELVPNVGLAAISKSQLMSISADGSLKVQSVNRTARWICPQAVQFVAEDRLFTYVRTKDNQLWVLDRETGQVRFRGAGTHFAAFATNTVDDTIYATTANGVVYAIKPLLQPGSPGYLQ
jgi:outer membrane protein assembly factor BamB